MRGGVKEMREAEDEKRSKVEPRGGEGGLRRRGEGERRRGGEKERRREREEEVSREGEKERR